MHHLRNNNSIMLAIYYVSSATHFHWNNMQLLDLLVCYSCPLHCHGLRQRRCHQRHHYTHVRRTRRLRLTQHICYSITLSTRTTNRSHTVRLDVFSFFTLWWDCFERQEVKNHPVAHTQARSVSHSDEGVHTKTWLMQYPEEYNSVLGRSSLLNFSESNVVPVRF
jgi:hypothetical protein